MRQPTRSSVRATLERLLGLRFVLVGFYRYIVQVTEFAIVRKHLNKSPPILRNRVSAPKTNDCTLVNGCEKLNTPATSELNNRPT